MSAARFDLDRLSPTISLIAAIGRQGQIGLRGALPWHDSQDLKWFRHMTRGAELVVGPKTAAQLPVLHGRRVWIDDRAWEDPLDFLRAHDLMASGQTPKVDIFVIGGAATYVRWLPQVGRLYLSRIAYDGEADTYMPSLWDDMTPGQS